MRSRISGSIFTASETAWKPRLSLPVLLGITFGDHLRDDPMRGASQRLRSGLTGRIFAGRTTAAVNSSNVASTPRSLASPAALGR